MSEETPFLSVCLITYNHEKFISKAIEGVLMQKTSFKFELVIADDCSTDNNLKIIKKYKQNYPDRIRILANKKNIGAAKTWEKLIFYPKSKYIAYFDGDDYWTDPYKLQKQVDFLENNKEFVMCSHDAIIVDENEKIIKERLLTKEFKKDFSKEELVKSPWIPSLTRCYRNIITEIPEKLKLVPNGDQMFTALLGQYGGNKYLGDIIQPAVYRQHNRGLWTSRSILQKIKMTSETNRLLADYFYEKGNEGVKEYYQNLVNSKIQDIVDQFIKINNRKDLIALKKLCKEYYIQEVDIKAYKEILKRLNKKIAQRVYTYPYYKLKNIGKSK